MALRMSSSPITSMSVWLRSTLNGSSPSKRSSTMPLSFSTKMEFLRALSWASLLAMMPMNEKASNRMPRMLSTMMPQMVAIMYLKKSFIVLFLELKFHGKVTHFF